MAARYQITVFDLACRFFAAQKSEVAATTLKFYKVNLLPFAKRHRDLPAVKLTPGTLRQWVESKPDASQYNAARTVLRLYNWAVGAKLLKESPVKGFRLPSQSRREFAPTPAQYVQCLKALTKTTRIDGVWVQVKVHVSSPQVRDVIKFLYHTGCRPQELRAIEAQWIDGDRIVFPLANSKGKRKQRIIYMDHMALAIATRLSRVYPTGPIFRTAEQRAWTRGNLGFQIDRLGKRVGIPQLCAYSFRHAHITRLLERGVDIATVAAISGNSVRMITDVYNHVASNKERLRSIVSGGDC